MEFKESSNVLHQGNSPDFSCNPLDIIEYAHESVAHVGSDKRYIIVNKGFADLCGYTPNAMAGLPWTVPLIPVDHPIMEAAHEQMLDNGNSELEIRCQHLHGPVFIAHVILVKGSEVDSPLPGFYCFLKDITEQVFKKKYEAVHEVKSFYGEESNAVLHKTIRALRLLSDCNDALIRIKNELELLQSVCNLLDETGGYRYAWVGYALHDEDKSVKPVAHTKMVAGYFDHSISWGDGERGNGPSGKAIKTGKPYLVENILQDKNLGPWRDQAIKRGYNSVVSFPLKSDGESFGALVIFASRESTFDTQEINLLERLAENLSFGIHSIRMDKKRQSAENYLVLENYVLQLIDLGLPLQGFLHKLVTKIESYLVEFMCSIMLLDDEGKHLLNGAAPSLDKAYLEAIDGIEIGEGVGSCGTACYRNENVFVGDISKSSLWKGYHDLCEAHQLKACHSIPITISDGTLLGSFAIYSKKIRILDEMELQLFERMAHFIGASIGKNRVHTALKESQERFQLLSLATNDGIYDWDLKTHKIWRNEAYYKLFGIDEVQNGYENWKDAIHVDDKDSTICSLQISFEEKSSTWSREYRYLKANGEYADIIDRGYIIYDHHDEPVRIIGAMTDISDMKQGEIMIQESEARFRTLYDDSPSMLFTLSTDGSIISVNKFGADHLGFQVDQLIGQSILDLSVADDKKIIMGKLASCVGAVGDVHRCEIRLIHRYMDILWVRATMRLIRAEGSEPKVLVTCEDISETRILSEQLEYQAEHDSLTGLINRGEFEKRLRRILASDMDRGAHALCYLDLDQFKVINDTCGHLAGDELIRQISELLSSKVRKRDTLARFGGDEFAVLMEHCTLEQATRLAKDLLSAVEAFRFHWEGSRFSIGVSIGVVPISDISGSVNDILSVADSACYAAKDAGRNRMHIYQVDDDELSKRRTEMRWVSRINHALEEDRLCLAAQNIQYLGDGDLDKGKHYEILIRMRSEDGEIIPPGVFLPAAERYNLSVKLDRWVVTTIFNWLINNPGELESLGLCAINLSGHTFGNDEFLNMLLNLFHSRKIPPGKICFEITETAAMANMGMAIQFMKALNHIGCKFALDDFGTGLSSFNYLKNLPVDYLKIDGSFIREIDKNPIDQAMVRSINDVGKVMGKQIIAEFVENDEIVRILKDIGVDYAQGYGIAKPKMLDLGKKGD